MSSTFSIGNCQLFYFHTRKDAVKDHSRKEKQLRKLKGIDLPFPYGCVWLEDSSFIGFAEVTVDLWAMDYGSRFDTTLARSEEISILMNYNVDSVYSTKSRVAYKDFLRHSLLLSTNMLYVGKVERPLVFTDSAGIFSYIQFLNKEINSIIEQRKEHWCWRKFSDRQLQVTYSLLTLEDYLLALKNYKRWTPTVEVTEGVNGEVPVPIGIYANYKGSEQATGLLNNASEIIVYNDRLYVIYNVQPDKILITRFTAPDYHIGFRIKCKVSKRDIGS
ncbi:hypothetical protein [Ohtaekwangia sp.]|uniref:hypothetical protein n=1 Tax=Ohtaekwangia sp. TaxID=2066019 RepID=UPI002F94B5E7